ncbi:phosphopantetheine-binding protein [Actinokineospora sp. HUAS TT18]|uniref:phosphopantetheine-binding protein n=1 Tax=Actinokineospora sp. HUAS TT18 TaxID=3447451 RepID=UPI003F51D158
MSNIRVRVEAIWKDVLSVQDGQEDATFFELGGESISAVRLVSRIEDELDVLIDVGDIFEDDPTVADLIATVTTKADEAKAA